jgi:transcription initiation factor TFIIE subunit alpha
MKKTPNKKKTVNAKKKAAPKTKKARKTAPKSKKAVKTKKAVPKKPALKNTKLIKKADLKTEITPKKPTAEQIQGMKKVTGILGDAYIRQSLIEVGGENALAIVRNFYGNHSDEELAKKLKIKISDVRATLNKLHNEGLVNYARAKDSETGWYSYSWTLNHNRMEKWATNQASKLNGEGAGEGEKYYCPSCGASTITGFEDAMSGDFRCTHCNRMLEFLDGAKMAEIFDRRRFQ